MRISYELPDRSVISINFEFAHLRKYLFHFLPHVRRCCPVPIEMNKCKAELNATRHRTDCEFEFLAAEKATHIPNMADRLSSFHWGAFYKCMYCNKDYDALKITQTQLGRCPNCLNYNTPERSVRFSFSRL